MSLDNAIHNVSAASSAIIFLHPIKGDFQDILAQLDGCMFLRNLTSHDVFAAWPDSDDQDMWWDRGKPLPEPYTHDNTTEQAEAALEKVMATIMWLHSQNITSDRIALLGWSQGGELALRIAITYPWTISTVVAIAGYLPDDSSAWLASENRTSRDSLDEDTNTLDEDTNILTARAPPDDQYNKLKVHMVHGTQDNSIKYEWGLATANRLREMGMPVEFEPMESVSHWPVTGKAGWSLSQKIQEWLAAPLGLDGNITHWQNGKCPGNLAASLDDVDTDR